MQRKTLFLLCALLPAVGSSLGAYYIGRRQAVPLVLAPAPVTELSTDDPYAYPGATLVARTQGSGTRICRYTTTDDIPAVLDYYQTRLIDPKMREMQARLTAMRARSLERLQEKRRQLGLPALPMPPVPVFGPRRLAFGPNTGGSFSSSWGSGSSRMSLQGDSGRRTASLSTSNNEREVTIQLEAGQGQTTIRTIVIQK